MRVKAGTDDHAHEINNEDTPTHRALVNLNMQLMNV